MNWRWKLGRFFGIDVDIHATCLMIEAALPTRAASVPPLARVVAALQRETVCDVWR